MSWFNKLTHAQQVEYCSSLKGSKKSKYCDVKTGLPKSQEELNSLTTKGSATTPSKTSQNPVTTLPEPSNEVAVSDDAESEEKRKHHYYDVKSSHVWAKKAEIKNLGQDIEGSSRHKRNEGRDWGTLENMVDNKDFGKKELIKLHAIHPDEVPEGHESSFWVIKEIMAKYPDDNRFKPEEKRFWIESYATHLEEGKKIAEAEKDPFRTADKFIAYLDGATNISFRDVSVSMAQFSLREWVRSVRRNKSSASGPVGKLFALLSQNELPEKRWRADEMEAAVTKKLAAIGAPDKFKEVIGGKPFASTMTGVKAVVDRFDEASVYEKIVMEREGESPFKSTQDCADYLSKTLGIKGVQFGNSLPDSERAEHLVHASSSFHDMADALGVSPEFLSFGGSLSIGFGSRGVAGSMAHYSPAHDFININRHNGYGSLGHEWSHGLDYHIAKAIKKNKPGFSAQSFSSGGSQYLADSTPFEDEYKKLKELTSKHLSRVVKDPKFRSCSNSFKGWIRNPKEVFARAFEMYLAKKMATNGKKNTYLVSKIDHFAWPTDEETSEFESVFDGIISKLSKSGF